jgi:hypothetical protein
MKLSRLKIKTFTNASLAALETALNAYTAGLAEPIYVRGHFGRADTGDYWAVLEYVD